MEGAFPLLINLPDDAVAPTPQGQLGLGANYFSANGRRNYGAILKQAFVQFKNLGGDKASGLKIGRFEFMDGSEIDPADANLATIKRERIMQRLIGPFIFSHIGRSFDGLHYTHNTNGGNFTIVAARPTEGVFQLRSLYELDIDCYYGAYSKSLKSKDSVHDL